MTRLTRAVGIAALAGVLAMTAWSAVLVPPPCCSPGCEACPVTICSPAAAATTVKFELQRIGPVMALHAPVSFELSARSLPDIAPAFVSHAFVRPMRN